MLTAHNFSALNRQTGRVTDFLAPASMTLGIDRGHSTDPSLTTESSLETLPATVGGAVYPRGTNFDKNHPQNDLAFLRLSTKSAETQINKKMAIAVFHGTASRSRASPSSKMCTTSVTRLIPPPALSAAAPPWSGPTRH